MSREPLNRAVSILLEYLSSVDLGFAAILLLLLPVTIFYLFFSSAICILLHCQASHTEVSKQNSTKLCQKVDSKLRQQCSSCKNEVALSKIGVLTATIFNLWWIKMIKTFTFLTSSRLMANTFWTKRDMTIGQGRVKV